MSGVLKKIGKSIKKVFKKVVKVVKKIVKSDLFKLVVIAAAIYFTAGAVAGMMPAAGAVGVGTGTLAPITTAAIPNLATGVGSTMVANTAGAAATGGLWSGVGSAIAGITPGQAALGSGVLNTVGAGMSSYADSETAKEEQKEEERLRDEKRKNSETTLNVYDTFQNRKEDRAGEVEVDAGGNTVYAAAPIASLSNVEEQKGQAYYDNSTNTYAQASGGKA